MIVAEWLNRCLGAAVEWFCTVGGLLLLALVAIVIVISVWDGKPPWKNEPRGWT